MVGKKHIKHNTTFGEIYEWLEKCVITYEDFLKQMEWRKNMSQLEIKIIKQGML